MTTSIRVVHPNPDVKRGVEYWEGVPATVGKCAPCASHVCLSSDLVWFSCADGVLGGFGHVSRVESLGSRTFLLKVLPRLSYCAPASSDTSAFEWKKARAAARGGRGQARTRALDCGAGVGRVTEHSLLPLVDEVHMVEPVAKFLAEAKRLSPKWAPLATPPSQSPFQARKAVHFHCATLQEIDPAQPYTSAQKGKGKELEPSVSVADADADAQADEGEGDAQSTTAGNQDEPFAYDVIWAQWCLQHLSDKDLIAFLKRARAALKDTTDEQGVIVVKENVCQEEVDGSERVWYDDEDHSITRSTQAYERVFREAGLQVVRCDVQLGLPDELFVVKM